MAQPVVEIHIPLVETRVRLLDDPGSEEAPEPGLEVEFGWISVVEDYLAKREESGEFELYADGEELGGDYLFFLTGADEQTLLAIAADVARLPGIPPGPYAIVTTDDSDEPGVGRNEPLPQR
ncbi:hypothetical protein [Kribbella ginsengisoli]|uniref:Uncharacterized protein n=1 Tax=Kribbella ginsengisoli TaxID=363865 RepID=A0ABP6XGY9_9ACTN